MKTLLSVVLGAALVLPLPAADPKKPEPFEDTLREAVKEYRAGKLEKELLAMAREVDRHALKKVQ